MRVMTDDIDTLLTHLESLVTLTETTWWSQAEDHVRMERTIQLVCEALRRAGRAHQLTSDDLRLSEVTALCRRIVAEARAAGLRIGDNDNWQ
jgi:hypothetical protein